MFRIKICGVTCVDDAVTAAEAGADALGLNFVAASPRCIDLESAAHIVDSLPDTVATVAVLVNPTLEDIARVGESLRLDYVQLHGDEPHELLADIEGPRLVKAFRCGETGLTHVPAYLESCQQGGVSLSAVLIDAYHQGAYGGTGETFPWRMLDPIRDGLSDIPLVLAGGLRPDNVAAAIAAVQPQAVDTASGVEVRPGRKDRDMVHHFVAAARDAFDALPARSQA